VDPLRTVGFGLLGVLVGTLGTLIGSGGGFLLLPILIVLYPNDPPAVLTAISLSVVLANATSGSIAYARMRRVDYRAGLLFSLAGVPGAVLGALLTHALNHHVFDPLLGVMLLVGAAIVVFRAKPAAFEPATVGSRTLVDATGETYVYSPRMGLGIVLSMGIGFLSSLLGIGGGIIHVPLMVYALGFPTHIATATSHFVLAWMALIAVIVHGVDGTLASALGRIVPLAIGVIPGAQIGAWLSTRFRGRWIMWALAAALASLGLRLLFLR
jgi:uncharacterized membrane protein YfcA